MGKTRTVARIPNVVKLIISIAVPLTGGFISGVFASRSIETWYKTLAKPSFAPPNWVFAPAWTILYIAIGIAAYLVWIRGSQLPEVRTALTVFLIQLALNFSWTPVFFGLRSPIGGLIIISILLAVIIVTLVLFWRISLPAGLLLIPYLLWVSFATALNFAIWQLN